LESSSGGSPEKWRRQREELRKFGLVESFRPVKGIWDKTYYGMNISRYKEPLDQMDVLLLQARFARAGIDNIFIPFIAGRYGQLNGRSIEGIIEAEEKKAKLMKYAMEAFRSGGLSAIRTENCETSPFFYALTTNALWGIPEYWDAVMEMKDIEGIIDKSRNGLSFLKVYETFESKLRERIPDEVVKALGDTDAPSLYRLFEVAEAKALKERFFVSTKIGPASEEEYDIFINQFMGIIQLNQPLDFKSRPGRLKPLIPYIGKEDENRIFLEDSKREIGIKLRKLAQRASGKPIYFDGFINPFVRMCVLAVEAAESERSGPVMMDSRPVSCGADMIDFFEKSGSDRFLKYSSLVTECLWAYLISPIFKAEKFFNQLAEQKKAEMVVNE
jgi:hypothetical protein